MKHLLSGMAALLFIATAARAQNPAPTAAAVPLVIGETFTIDSRILGETRRINVYTPPEIAPRAGGSEVFRKFIRSELMPQVKSRYRTTEEAAIVGESLAGLFVMETFLLEPDLFDTYIAFDPSLWWNHRAQGVSSFAQAQGEPVARLWYGRQPGYDVANP